MNSNTLLADLQAALEARTSLFEPNHESAFRLFNGFYEGYPDLAIDLYARTLVFHDYNETGALPPELIQQIQDFLLESLPWVEAIVLKPRHAEEFEQRSGELIYGSRPSRRVREHGIWYALDLMLNRDASLYLDTRNVRGWTLDHLEGHTVLNTFAYTGSFGVAAQAAGASHVVQTDRNREFLNLAKQSYALNGFPVQRADFRAGDFFTLVSQMKRARETFDCVFVDPPIFSTSQQGTVDLLNEGQRVINKVRPLVNAGGWLVAINNAVFLSGAAYLEMLEALTADGYLAIDQLIPVPPDFTGYPSTVRRPPLVDPAPFNHSTKIAVLKVLRKKG